MTEIQPKSKAFSNPIQNIATAFLDQAQNPIAISLLITCSQQVKKIAYHVAYFIQYEKLTSLFDIQQFAQHFIQAKSFPLPQESTAVKAQQMAYANALVPYNPIDFAKLVQKQQETGRLEIEPKMDKDDRQESQNVTEQKSKDLSAHQEPASCTSIQQEDPTPPPSNIKLIASEFYQQSEQLTAHDIGIAFLQEISQLTEKEILNSSIYLRSPEQYRQFCPHLSNIRQILSNIAHTTALTILSYQKLEDRVQAMEKFIRIAHLCFKNYNIAGAEAIYAGLSQASIISLEQTWEDLSSPAAEMFEEMEKYFNNQRNAYLTRYRKNIECHLETAIPNMVLFLPFIDLAQAGLEDLKKQIKIKQTENECIDMHQTNQLLSQVNVYTESLLKVNNRTKELGSNTLILTNKLKEKLGIAINITTLSNKEIKQKHKDNLDFIAESPKLIAERERSLQVIVDSLMKFAKQAKQRLHAECISPFVQQIAHWHLSKEGKSWDEDEAYEKARQLEPRYTTMIFVDE